MQLYLGSEPRIEKLNDVKNQMFIKPLGGMWTSTFEDGTSSWEIESEKMGIYEMVGIIPERWKVKVRDDVRLLVVDSLEDLKKVFEKYELSDERFKNIVMLRFLDYEKIGLDYDGMRLTRKGEYETRHSRPVNLYGWDCECTLWFRWVFEMVESI